MKLFLIALLLQPLPLPPRRAMENPAAASEVPKNLKKDYDKLWTRFLAGKEDAKVVKDLEKLLRKQKDFSAAVTVEAYIDLYQHHDSSAVQKLEQVLSISLDNRIALYYLAELAFARGDYARSSDLYSRLLAVDKTRTDVEAKRQKSLLLATENLLQSAAKAEEEKRLLAAEELYRQTLGIAPHEPAFHARLAELLAKEQKWDEALVHYRTQLELGGRSPGVERNIAEALMNLGRTEEARDVLDRLRKEGSVDEGLDAKVNELEDLGRWGNDIESFREIKSTRVLTREQLAPLIIRYFPQVSEFRQTPQIVTDTQTSWARTEVQIVVGVGLVDPFPNHTFRPSAPITRGEFALAIARLARLLTVSSSDAPPIPLSDLGSRNALYPEIQLVLSHGLMALDSAGNFGINGEVSGEEAVLVMERLLRLSHGKDTKD
jgi:tetratricopeptide (TPR) repeat protein